MPLGDVAKPPSALSRSGLGQGEALQLYRTLLLARRAEETICEEYGKDDMKTPVHLGIGQEAIATGVWHCLPPGSRACGTYRNHALYLAVTGETEQFFGELYGKATGLAKGKAGSMHLAAPEQGLVATSAVVGTTIPLAVGAAFANRYRGLDDLVAVFFGDGAVEEGVFWESLNFACLQKLRLLFVCEDNGLAIHTPTMNRQGFRSIPDAVAGFRCHVISDNGSDLDAVISATRAMLARMRKEPMPGLLHLQCYRMLEHVGTREDFGAGYRRRPTPEELDRLDPVLVFESALRRMGCLAEELQRVRAAVDEQIARSVQRAQQAPFAPPEELMTDVWAP